MSDGVQKDAVGRSEQVRALERVGTGILGVGIVIMMIAIPLMVAILLLYLWVK